MLIMRITGEVISGHFICWWHWAVTLSRACTCLRRPVSVEGPCMQLGQTKWRLRPQYHTAAQLNFQHLLVFISLCGCLSPSRLCIINKVQCPRLLRLGHRRKCSLCHDILDHVLSWRISYQAMRWSMPLCGNNCNRETEASHPQLWDTGAVCGSRLGSGSSSLSQGLKQLQSQPTSSLQLYDGNSWSTRSVRDSKCLLVF